MHRFCVHFQSHQAERGPGFVDDVGKHMLTNVHSCGVSLTPNALAAVRTTGAPTTAAPTYAPDGTPPWPLAAHGRAGTLRRPLIGCGLRGHAGSAQARHGKRR